MSFSPNPMDFVVRAVVHNQTLKFENNKSIFIQYWPQGDFDPSKPPAPFEPGKAKIYPGLTVVNAFRQNAEVAMDPKWWTVADAGKAEVFSKAGSARARIAKLTFRGAEFSKAYLAQEQHDKLQRAVHDAFIERDRIQLYVAMGTFAPEDDGCGAPPPPYVQYIAALNLQLGYGQAEHLKD